jgi:RNA polymerase sigma-70 factor (ECF subfamily)
MSTSQADRAVDALVRKYGQKVYNIAYRITANHHDAEDVTQETFIQVHRNLHMFRGESTPYTWIYRIAVNASLQFRRQADKAYIDRLDATILEFRDDLPDDVRHWQNDPETRHIYDHLLSEVQKACYHFITYRLTDEQRVVYVLRVILGFSLDDIAEILDLDKNTVKARLQRAKASLKSYFSGRCQWIEGGGDCSCESRLGFALSAAPEILQRVRNHPPDKSSKQIVRDTLAEVDNLDTIYSRLPTLPYQARALEYYLK